MMHKKRWYFLLLWSLLGILFCTTLVLFSGYRFSLLSEHRGTQVLTKVQYSVNDIPQGELTLPKILKNMDAHTPVTLTAVLKPGPDSALMLRSVFSPAKLYLDDVLVAEAGQPSHYPSFLNDPPTVHTILHLPERPNTVTLRIELLSPTQRSELSLPVMYIGSEGALITRLFEGNAFSLWFAIIIIFFGVTMVFVAALTMHKTPGSQPFLWLGFFAAMSGIWVFGENDLVALLIPYPSLLYAMEYLGLFCLTLPLLRFVTLILTPQNRLSLNLTLALHCISIPIILLLQLTGKMDFTRSLYWIHIIAPFGFVVVAANSLWEYFRHRNLAAKRFTCAVVLLALFVLLEVLNYWLRLTPTFSVMFQLGMILFIAALAYESFCFLRAAMQAAAEKQKLEAEVANMGQLLNLQESQYKRIAQDTEMVKSMRHDMHHHLAAIGRLADREPPEAIRSYIENLQIRLADSLETQYCKNHIVNAVVGHYINLAQREGIATEVRLNIPENTGSVPAMDLCVILGNFLENAVEACQNVKESNKFLGVRSRIAEDTLSLVVTNSFSGTWQEENGSYHSLKRGGTVPGVGLASVAAICAKHRGITNYQARENIWKSSALVHMQAQNAEHNQ